MKKRTLDILIAALFCLAIFAVPALFLFLPQQSFSPLEKRYLAQMPDLRTPGGSWEERRDAVDDAVADQFPGRSFFVGVNAYYDLLSGRQATKDYFPGADGRLFAAPFDWEPADLEPELEAIDAFSRDLAASGADIPLSLMLVPSSGAVLLDEPAYPDAAIVDYVYDRVDANCVELLELFRSDPEPGRLYYRTDHHWTSEGAFEAACAYRRSLGQSCPERERYTVQRCDAPFYGSAWSASGLWLTEPDSLELWWSPRVLQVSDETGAVRDSVFSLDRLEEQDKYSVYLDGNHSLVRIEALAPDQEERALLVIRDSFSNSLGCFLADLYSKVILVDLRYYKLPLTDLIAEEGIDEILIEYSVDNFVHDANLSFLSVDPTALRPAPEPEPEEEPVPPPPNYFVPPEELDPAIFDGAYYLGDSVNGILNMYCLDRGLLPNTFISSNALLSFYEVAEQIEAHLIYKGWFVKLPVVMEDLQPEVMIVALGCNDLAGYDLEESEAHVLAFLDLVRELSPDITIFMQSVMPIRVNMTTFNQEEVDAFNAWLKEKAEELDYCYIELDSYFKAPDGALSFDYMYNETHISLVGAPLWYQELLNIENYYNFPQRFCVEIDGATGLPVGSAPAETEEPAEEPAEPDVPEEPVPEETILDRIYAEIRGRVECPEMLQLAERAVSGHLGIRPERYERGNFYLCANNLKADEIWLVETADEDAAQAMLALAQERIELKASSYDKYLPEESAVARRGIAIAQGRYVALFLSPEAETMRDIFLAALAREG